MEHMKFVHKDPNASGVPGEFDFPPWDLLLLISPPPSKETERQPPVPRVRQVLRERGQPEEAPGLPPRDDQPARLQFAHVALLRLHRSLHPRERWADLTYL